MSGETPNKEPRKLTAEDVPEAFGDAPSPQSGIYCRFFVSEGAGWREYACSGGYDSEEACREAARRDGADSYTWSYKSC